LAVGSNGTTSNVDLPLIVLFDEEHAGKTDQGLWAGPTQTSTTSLSLG
jgi:hypothetical protein